MWPLSSLSASKRTEPKTESQTGREIILFHHPASTPSQYSLRATTDALYHAVTKPLYSDQDAFNKAWLKRRGEWQQIELQKKVNREAQHKVGQEKNHPKPKPSTHALQNMESRSSLKKLVICLLVDLTDFLCCENFLNVVIIGIECLRLWDWDAFLTCLIIEMWLFQTKAATTEENSTKKRNGM